MAFPSAASIFISLAGLIGVIAWRLREARTAVTLRKIIIPPLGMATGFSMFILPAFRVHWAWAALAYGIGYVVLAYPLLLTTKLVRVGDVIMMKRSSAFLAVILVLAAIRFFARGYFDTILDAKQSAGIFFILAFGMIVRWRVSLVLEFRKLMAAQPTALANL